MIREIIDIILNYIDPEEKITENTNIKSDLGMSSFDLVCFADELFEKYGVSLTPDIFREFTTVGELSEYVSRNK